MTLQKYKQTRIKSCAYLFLSTAECMSARMWNGLRCWLPAEDGGTTASRMYTPPGWSWDDEEVDGTTGRRGMGATPPPPKTPLDEVAWPEEWWQHEPELEPGGTALPEWFWRSRITVSPDEFMDMEEFERESAPPAEMLLSHVERSAPPPLKWLCCCLEIIK